MGRLFGTDGIRGVAGVDLTASLAEALGRAVGDLLAGPGRSVVIGQDTRGSGPMLVEALGRGLTPTGTDAVRIGVITTPGLVFTALGADHAAGIMVSGSHNPAPDNGLKVVAGDGKIDEALELELERHMSGRSEVAHRGAPASGSVRDDAGAVGAYLTFLAKTAGDAVAGLRIGLDCANGSASAIAPELFGTLGAEVTVIAASPDGTNINLESGSMHPERLSTVVRERGLDLGLAFDGDADRLIAVDERGELVDGDRIMGICALERQRRGTLRNNLVVATVMSNGGLARTLAAAGVRMLRTPVGDRHVLAAMEQEGAVLGGEQSGHIIFRDRARTGDGILSAIELISALRAADGRTLGELADRFPMLPQVVINSAVRRKEAWEGDPAFAAAVRRAEARLRAGGRILVRPSGTEPKIRIMVEGDREDEIHEIARELHQLAEARFN